MKKILGMLITKMTKPIIYRHKTKKTAVSLFLWLTAFLHLFFEIST